MNKPEDFTGYLLNNLANVEIIIKHQNIHLKLTFLK